MAFENSPSLQDLENNQPGNLPAADKKRKILWGAILILFIISLGLAIKTMSDDGSLSILTQTGGINGIVQDQSGNPIQAEIWITGTDLYTLSNSNGEFNLAGIPAGQQTVLVAYRLIGREYSVSIKEGEIQAMGILRFEASDFENGWSQGTE